MKAAFFRLMECGLRDNENTEYVKQLRIMASKHINAAQEIYHQQQKLIAVKPYSTVPYQYCYIAINIVNFRILIERIIYSDIMLMKELLWDSKNR